MKAAGRRKLLLALAMTISLTGVPAGIVYATSTQDKLNQAQEDKKQTESQLNETKENLVNLKEEKNQLEGKLADLNEKLTVVSNNLNDLEEQISQKETEIQNTEEELAEAKITEQNQYESMKTRIRFMYERSDYALIETLLGSGSLAEALNKADYVEQVAAYDRQKLDEYEATRIRIQEEEAKLKKEKEELDALKEKVQAEKKKVNSYVKQTSSEITATSGEISDAEAKALAYEAQIKEQEANIECLKKKLAEEQALSKLAAQSKWRDISEVKFEENDRYLLANLIYCEAGGEPYAGQVAVGAVVINRVLSSVYPNTVTGVIYQKYQFSPVGSGRLALALAQNKATASCYKAADEAMAGQTNVGNCVYFRTPIPGLTGIQIGGHIFY
ncbi:MAG: cell wall hydrolase [Lachnospiraceae bacterium]|nr:cell wall hydrolase [Lachnospiraceae bacterium]